jgi:hypothetical protein
MRNYKRVILTAYNDGDLFDSRRLHHFEKKRPFSFRAFSFW